MAGTTTNFAIPYPSSTDYVTDGATAMRSIADQVDAVLFTGSSSGNLLINGAMQVSQRSVSVASITSSNYYTADRWKTTNITAGTWTQTIENDAPTGSGFRKSLKMLCTTADASLGVNDELDIRQTLEGLNVQSIRKGTSSAQPLNLSFWVKSNVVGNYVCWLYDADNVRIVGKTYSILASNTWEFKTVTFPADITGIFDNDANGSLVASFQLAAGSNFTSGTLSTSWASYSAANQAPSQVNVAAAINNYWQMTGAQLTVGSVATPFQFKSWADDLRACQRYYYRRSQVGGYNHVEGISMGVNFNNSFFTQVQHPIEMRAAPVFSVVSGNSGVDNYGAASAMTYSSQQTTTKGGRLSFSTSGLSNYVPFFYIGNPDVTVQFLAEL